MERNFLKPRHTPQEHDGDEIYWSGSLMNDNFPKLLIMYLFQFFQIIPGLHIHPEFRGIPKKAGKP